MAERINCQIAFCNRVYLGHDCCRSPFLPTPEAGGAPPQPVTRPQFLKDPADGAPLFDAKTFSTAQLHTFIANPS
jgi:hypothetical protein